jgi:hypothetical protein
MSDETADTLLLTHNGDLEKIIELMSSSPQKKKK